MRIAIMKSGSHFFLLFLILTAFFPAFAQNTSKQIAPISIPFSLDSLEKRSFDYFWKLTDRQFQTPDRWPNLSFSSIAATGFGLSAYLVGVERNYITRAQAAERVLKTLEVLKNLPQGPQAQGVAGHRGFYYHFLDHQEALRYRDVELSTIDSGLLLAGILSCMSFFDQNNPSENAIRETADFIYRRVEWPWMLNENQRLSMGWKPEKGFLQAEWFGYTEAMILYVLALGSPTHPINPESWEAWTQNYVWDTYEGQEHINFGPLFGHQYSHIWIDFKGIKDPYMQKKGLDYAENTRRATLANYNYCKRNPKKFKAYSDKIWGLTACDGPADWLYKHDLAQSCAADRQNFMGYSARGVASDYNTDDGTIAPTAAGGSLPFAPEICLPALETMWNTYFDSLVGPFGFKDAFNPTFTACGKLPNGWFDEDYLGIDQGPIVLMIENYRSGFLWNLMKKNPYIRTGLQKAGFEGGWLGNKTSIKSKTKTLPNLEVPNNPFYFFDRGVYREDAQFALPYRLLKPNNILATNQVQGFYSQPDGSLVGNTAETKYQNLKLPLVIYLHDTEACGHDNESQLRSGILGLCEPESWKKHPCFLLVPQCPSNLIWSDISTKSNKEIPEKPMQLLLNLLNQILLENPAIDPNRIYVTGQGMGGTAVADLLSRRPNLFAAALPISAEYDASMAPALRTIPIWLFHGARNERIPATTARNMLEAIKLSGGKPTYTEFTTLGHALGQEIFYNPKVIDWLFSQHR